jgi:ubiquinol-cytochrome c reductase core subunit 2
LPKEPIKVTKLDNGIICASLENYSPVSRVAAVLNVGTRDETPEQVGASHALRVYSSLATRNYSLFGLSRNLDQVGAQLSVVSSRESLTYLLETDRRNM